MSFRTIRDWGKTIVGVGFFYNVAWCLVAVGVAALLLGYALFQGQFEQALGLSMLVLGGLAVLVFLAWMTHDAEENAGRIRELHKKEMRERSDGDLSEVAGTPRLPPWMG